jgi:DNA-binding Lrp family transcriptional regulator
MAHEPQALDRIDHEILAALQKNARLSNKELAAEVGLAPSSCLARVARLIRDGVLRGFHADVDPKALGIGLEALVFVRVVRHQSALMAGLWDHLISLPEVREVYYVAGSHDLVVHVVVRDVEHLRAGGRANCRARGAGAARDLADLLALAQRGDPRLRARRSSTAARTYVEIVCCGGWRS